MGLNFFSKNKIRFFHYDVIGEVITIFEQRGPFRSSFGSTFLAIHFFHDLFDSNHQNRAKFGKKLNFYVFVTFHGSYTLKWPFLGVYDPLNLVF